MVVRSSLIAPVFAPFPASAGCSRIGAEPPSIVSSGATLVDGASAPPVANSVFIISGGTTAAMGEASETPIPAGASRFDGNGRFIFSAQPGAPLRAGGPATFLLLPVNPALNSDYATRIAGRMQDGRWMQFPR
jgi:hypothetical protein